MPRKVTPPLPYSPPTAEERAEGSVIYCDGCNRDWPADRAVLRLKKCVNCARAWWRAAQAAKRTGSGAPPLRAARPVSKKLDDVDAHLAKLTSQPEKRVRGPRVKGPQFDPNESIDSIASRLSGGEAVMLLPSEKKR